MIHNLLIHRLPEVINSPKMDKFKSERFDELYPLYQKLELERYNAKDNLITAGNMSLFADRTGTIPHYLKVSGVTPLPKVEPTFNKSFKQICLETAKDLVERANGEQIVVSWSGGLDSTTALFSLMQYADPKQILVACNYYSIIESGSVFDKFIKGRGIRYSLSTPMNNPEFSSGIIVSGYLGDQLFGKVQTLSQEQFTMNWRDSLTLDQVDCMEKILDNYPLKVETLPEFQAFIELNSKWHMGQTNRKRNMPSQIADRMYNFYETDDFQRWSLGNYEPKFLSSDPLTFKWPIRCLLKELMETDYYSANKVIQTSHYHILDHKWVMLLEDGTNLYLKDFV